MDIFSTYEQHYGLSGRPFATTPDPDFYFESRGHRRAFAYLRNAVLEGECFMVMTGESGAGKTMLVRKLVLGLESERIVPAIVAGTTLDAPALLMGVLLAFHIPAVENSVEELRARLQGFLASLTATGRRALVVVDEAQHLKPDAVDELVRLAKLQTMSGQSLSVLLAGQSELRAALQASAMAMREPAFLCCDIGLLSLSETRAYIEHRLRHVGWAQNPSFSDDAYERIYRDTDGVPRRINRLCNRLLMTAAHRELNLVTAEVVEETTAELSDEIGDVVAPVIVATEASERALPSAHEEATTPSRSAIPTLFTGVDIDIRPAEPSIEPESSAREQAVSPVRQPEIATSRRRWPVIGVAVLAVSAVIGWYFFQAMPVMTPPDVTPVVETDDETGANGETPADTAAGQVTETAPSVIDSQPAADAPATASPVPVETVPTAQADPHAGATPVVAKPAKLRAAPYAGKSKRAQPSRLKSVRNESARAKPRTASSATPPAPPAVSGSCTASVAALGLCTPANNR